MELTKQCFDRGSYQDLLPMLDPHLVSKDPAALYTIGYMQFYGQAMPVDRQQAIHNIREAAKQKYYLAMVAISMLNEKYEHSIIEPVVIARSIYHKQESKKPVLALDDDYLLLQSNYYTIQMAASYDFAYLKSIMKQYSLYDGYYIYRTCKQGKAWYVLLNGLYKSHQLAKQLLAKLPSSLKKQQPFVQKISNVHGQIQAYTVFCEQ